MTPRYFWRHPGKGARQLVDILRVGLAPLGNSMEGMPKDFQELLQTHDETAQNATCNNKFLYGGHLQGQRVAAMADYCLSRYPGDIVEIGCYTGKTTVLLAQVARKYGRRVVGIDPWIPGTQDCDGVEFEEFQTRIAPHKEIIDVWKSSSLEAEVIKRLRGREIGFAFVDGWHVYHACLSDFHAVGHTRGAIACDDVRYNREVCLALRMVAKQLGRPAVHLPKFREGLILPTKW